MPNPKIIETDAAPLIDLETCRRQCEVVAIDFDSDTAEATHPDDPQILIYLGAAIGMAEQFTGLALRLRTYELALDAFPTCPAYIELPRPPFVSLISVTYGDEEDVTSDGEIYDVDDSHQFARVRPVDGRWPDVVTAPNAIKVRYVAGYVGSEPNSDGALAPQLPEDIKAAILLMLAHLYEHRKDTADNSLASIPSGFRFMLKPYDVQTHLA